MNENRTVTTSHDDKYSELVDPCQNQSKLNQEQLAKQIYELHPGMALRKQQNQTNPIIRNTTTNIPTHDKTEQNPFNHVASYQNDLTKSQTLRQQQQQALMPRKRSDLLAPTSGQAYHHDGPINEVVLRNMGSTPNYDLPPQRMPGKDQATDSLKLKYKSMLMSGNRRKKQSGASLDLNSVQANSVNNRPSVYKKGFHSPANSDIAVTNSPIANLADSKVKSMSDPAVGAACTPHDDESTLPITSSVGMNINDPTSGKAVNVSLTPSTSNTISLDGIVPMQGRHVQSVIGHPNKWQTSTNDASAATVSATFMSPFGDMNETNNAHTIPANYHPRPNGTDSNLQQANHPVPSLQVQVSQQQSQQQQQQQQQQVHQPHLQAAHPEAFIPNQEIDHFHSSIPKRPGQGNEQQPLSLKEIRYNSSQITYRQQINRKQQHRKHQEQWMKRPPRPPIIPKAKGKEQIRRGPIPHASRIIIQQQLQQNSMQKQQQIRNNSQFQQHAVSSVPLLQQNLNHNNPSNLQQNQNNFVAGHSMLRTQANNQTNLGNYQDHSNLPEHYMINTDPNRINDTFTNASQGPQSTQNPLPATSQTMQQYQHAPITPQNPSTLNVVPEYDIHENPVGNWTTNNSNKINSGQDGLIVTTPNSYAPNIHFSQQAQIRGINLTTYAREQGQSRASQDFGNFVRLQQPQTFPQQQHHQPQPQQQQQQQHFAHQQTPSNIRQTLATMQQQQQQHQQHPKQQQQHQPIMQEPSNIDQQQQYYANFNAENDFNQHSFMPNSAEFNDPNKRNSFEQNIHLPTENQRSIIDRVINPEENFNHNNNDNLTNIYNSINLGNYSNMDNPFNMLKDGNNVTDVNEFISYLHDT